MYIEGFIEDNVKSREVRVIIYCREVASSASRIDHAKKNNSYASLIRDAWSLLKSP